MRNLYYGWHTIWATWQNRARLSPTRLNKSTSMRKLNYCSHSTLVPWENPLALDGFNHHRYDPLVPGPYHQLRPLPKLLMHLPYYLLIVTPGYPRNASNLIG